MPQTFVPFETVVCVSETHPTPKLSQNGQPREPRWDAPMARPENPRLGQTLIIAQVCGPWLRFWEHWPELLTETKGVPAEVWPWWHASRFATPEALEQARCNNA